MEWNPQQYLQQSKMQFFIGKLALVKLQPSSSETVLDVGCGIGTLTREIAVKTAPGAVIGIDIDPQMIAYANSELKAHPQSNLSFIQQDCINLTFQTCFNAIFSNIVLHWVKPLQVLFEKFFLALKEGGRLQIATIFEDTSTPPNIFQEAPYTALESSPKIQIQQIENRILQEFMIKGYYKEFLSLEEFQAHQSSVNPNRTYKVYKPMELEAMLDKAGFTGIKHEHQIYWHEFDDLGSYLEYRQSNIWLFFLGFFPPQYRPQLINKLNYLIQTGWNALPASQKELPIREKWPILFIQATK
ncbi:MAG: type 11 methyltransferase [Promethearchaeota archaeon CR_4]|nr:MAG: type 11 methyltransferase [Candidatus Lokiarchaeota archaeon CR_4]